MPFLSSGVSTFLLYLRPISRSNYEVKNLLKIKYLVLLPNPAILEKAEKDLFSVCVFDPSF